MRREDVRRHEPARTLCEPDLPLAPAVRAALRRRRVAPRAEDHVAGICAPVAPELPTKLGNIRTPESQAARRAAPVGYCGGEGEIFESASVTVFAAITAA